jgi:hypothetical protein
LEINFVVKRDIGTFRRLYIKDIDLTYLAVTEASRALVHEKGINPPYKLKSLASWWDIGIIKRIRIPGMHLKALTMVNEGKKGLYDLN